MPFMQPKGGWVELICGSMFSGKTEELIRRVRRAQIARQNIQVFKPQIDNRYAVARVASHSGLQWDSHTINAVSYTHLRAHETVLDLVCRLLLEKKTTITNM